ncbi:flagellar biosynthetic protein FliO [Pseudoalteromonas sp. SSDWG2]|uniref:flagellar biosynthetic protein FliO n=1 Tax=Pseudoalteromonas sp. SSDWG2 TaxID=3139391 RepID=UPI003BA8D80B
MSRAVILLMIAMLPLWGCANTGTAQTGTGLNLDLLSMLMSLALVVITILILAFFVKRLNPNMTASADFKVVRTLALGTKERLLVVEIDNKQHLLGVTPNAINYLYELEKPLSEREMTPLAKQLSHILNTKNKT